MCDGIKTPTPPLPDLEDPNVRKYEFESLNEGYYYSEHTFELFSYLHNEVTKTLPEKPYWNLALSEL